MPASAGGRKYPVSGYKGELMASGGAVVYDIPLADACVGGCTAPVGGLTQTTLYNTITIRAVNEIGASVKSQAMDVSVQTLAAPPDTAQILHLYALFLHKCRQATPKGQQHQRAGVGAATKGGAPQDRLIRGIHPVPGETGHGDGEQILGIEGGGKNGRITDVRKKDGCRHREGGQGNEGDGNDIV